MSAVVVALIGALGMVLAAMVPALIVGLRAKGAAEAAQEASVSAKDTVHDRSTTVEALLFRLEGKVDALAEEVREVLTWKAVHTERHSHLPIEAAALAEVVRLWDREDREDNPSTGASGAT